MPAFLDPRLINELRIDIITDRTQHLLEGGGASFAFRPTDVFRGSVDFHPVPLDEADQNPNLALARADAPNTGFFIDLLAEKRLRKTAGAVDAPVWFSPTGITDVNRLELLAVHRTLGADGLPDADYVHEGDYVSIRQSIVPDFVTARTIVEITLDSQGDAIALYDTPLPHEFVPLAASTRLQYCVNRPHVRARFTEDPRRHRRDPQAMYPRGADWIEDLPGALQALRAISGVVGLPPGAITTESGIALRRENGEPLTRESAS